MKKLNLLTLLIVFIFSSTAYADVELNGTKAELETFINAERELIKIEGFYEDKLTVEDAYVKLNIEVERDTLSLAVSVVNGLVRQISGQLSSAGFKEDALISDAFSSTPETGWLSDRPSSYSVIKKLKVKVQNDDQFIEVARLVDSLREVRYQGIELEQEVDAELKRETIKKAIAELKKNVALYETEMPVKLKFVRFDTYFDRQQVEVQAMRSKRARSSFLSSYESGSSAGLAIVDYDVICRVVGTYEFE